MRVLGHERRRGAPPGGHQQLVVSAGQGDLEADQQPEERGQVGAGEAAALQQQPLHQGALQDALRVLPLPP